MLSEWIFDARPDHFRPAGAAGPFFTCLSTEQADTGVAVRNCGTPLFNRSVSPQLHSCGIAEFRTPAAVAREAAPSKCKLSLTFLHSRIEQNSRPPPASAIV